MLRISEPHVGKTPAGIDGLENPDPGHGTPENVGFSRSHPDDLGIGRSNGEISDRCGRIVFKNCVPIDSIIGGLPDAPLRSGCIDRFRLRRMYLHVGHASARPHRADSRPLQILERRFGAHCLVFLELAQSPLGFGGVLGFCGSAAGRARPDQGKGQHKNDEKIRLQAVVGSHRVSLSALVLLPGPANDGGCDMS